MAKRSDRNLIVGLDIGTSKVAAMVGEMHADGSLKSSPRLQSSAHEEGRSRPHD
jgi:cell division ATPase FtsA